MNNKEQKLERLNNFSGTKITENIYNLIIGAVVLWGVTINIIMSQVFSEQICNMNYIVMLIIYFIGSLISMFVVYASKNPVISFFGFTGLSISMGLLLTYFVSFFEIGSILLAFATTAIVTGIMMLAATIFPAFFKGLGRVLFFTLLITVIAEIILSVILGIGTTFFDFLIVVIFCGYIGYDWTKAQEYPKTLDNAVDSAADIYVDIINLFVRILSIVGKIKE